MDERVAARRLAHTIKGVAGNISAQDVQTAAAEMEAAIKSWQPESFSRLTSQLAAALDTVMNSLAVTVMSDVVSAPCKKAVEATDPAVLMESLEELSALLLSRKPKPCMACSETIGGYGWPENMINDVVELTNLTTKYKFKDAYTLVQRLIDRLKSTACAPYKSPS